MGGWSVVVVVIYLTVPGILFCWWKVKVTFNEIYSFKEREKVKTEMLNCYQSGGSHCFVTIRRLADTVACNAYAP